MTTPRRRLTLQVVVPDAAQRQAYVEVRPLVDGEDFLMDVFTVGPGEDPGRLLRPGSPLLPADKPHEVRVAEATCTEGCCGAVYVTIRREGDSVVWSDWRNPDARNFDLPEFWFDATEYQAEVERAVADHGWEWPARTVARLLKQDLAERTDWLMHWECELGAVSAWHWEPDQINVFFFHPGSPTVEDRPWLQFRQRLAVTDADPARQAEQLAQQLIARDPRRTAEVCGGSADFARKLGYPWIGG
ncbi:hypothetical protein E1263_29945 [Kribbella antibiotica]|uniref:Uncharacterized protein n=1 Tax=Kribbella antibiotica TaxID=190195 RepID=A0A4R4Z1H3_9ACTN|nr:hypothetical protein [Kribbella antibiotica]TDD51606.1 hypothetical protein E1263_29945 [Kribbella antibiotica]